MNSVIGFKRKTVTHVPLPASFLGAQEALGLAPVGFPKGFEYRRRKGFTEVWLHFQNGLRLNLTEPREDWPKDFKAARVWGSRFADAHGFTYRELDFHGVLKPVSPAQGEPQKT